MTCEDDVCLLHVVQPVWVGVCALEGSEKCCTVVHALPSGMSNPLGG